VEEVCARRQRAGGLGRASQEVSGLTKAELIAAVAERTGLKKKDLDTILDAVLAVIAATLKKHEKVQISGFGTFEARRRRARTGRNPRTQEMIRVGPSWSLGFRAGKQLKQVVSGKAGSASGR
jgi:DNA-binding protein HU-beta